MTAVQIESAPDPQEGPYSISLKDIEEAQAKLPERPAQPRTVCVRPMSKDDIGDVAALGSSVWGNWAFPDWIYHQFAAMGDCPLPAVLVARDISSNSEGELLGYTSLLTRPKVRLSHIFSMTIAPHAQGAHVGTNLLDEVHRCCKLAGVGGHTEAIYKHNFRSQKLFSRGIQEFSDPQLAVIGGGRGYYEPDDSEVLFFMHNLDGASPFDVELKQPWISPIQSPLGSLTCECLLSSLAHPEREEVDHEAILLIEFSRNNSPHPLPITLVRQCGDFLPECIQLVRDNSGTLLGYSFTAWMPGSKAVVQTCVSRDATFEKQADVKRFLLECNGARFGEIVEFSGY